MELARYVNCHFWFLCWRAPAVPGLKCLLKGWVQGSTAQGMMQWDGGASKLWVHCFFCGRGPATLRLMSKGVDWQKHSRELGV